MKENAKKKSDQIITDNARRTIVYRPKPINAIECFKDELKNKGSEYLHDFCRDFDEMQSLKHNIFDKSNHTPEECKRMDDECERIYQEFVKSVDTDKLFE